MKYTHPEYQLNKLGDLLIEKIKSRTNVFDSMTVVFPSDKIAQWFKTYWLKTQDDVLMNVKFKNIDDALLELIDSEKQYQLLTRENFKSFIIKHLALEEVDIPEDIKNYLFNKDGSINSIKIYDLANALSKLYIAYENDNFKISGWQKQLYDLVLKDSSEFGFVTLSYLLNSSNIVKQVKNEMVLFGFSSFTKLQERILEKYTEASNITLFSLQQDKKYSKEYEITSAPSKLREIEVVHTEICKLLQNKNNTYSDFLIVAPDISAYEGVIPRVFIQDNINFPNIPYGINDRKRVETNLSVGLKKLFEIYNKKFYSRLDFFELINNKDIQLARELTAEDIQNFSESIVAMNVYRNCENSDDWDYAKKRILLSKISGINDINENVIELKCDSYLPYTNIYFDDSAIVKFVKIIEDLKKWQQLLSEIKFVNRENLLKIKNELNKWFSIKDENGFETNKHLKHVLKVINSWYTMNISLDTIPLNTLFYMLFDSSIATEFNSSDCFVKGITFSDYDENAILSAKYVFFLNAGSNEFPRPTIKSELDLREYDITEKEKKEAAFFIQYQNATNKFYISYVNKNLKTDEDFFPSSFIIKLQERLKIKPKEITLDETRSWNELFTRKEYKNKDYYLSLLSSRENEEIIDESQHSHEPLKKYRIKDIADFLEEPLKYKATNLFGRKSELDDKLRIEFEQLYMDSMDEFSIYKKLLSDLLIEKEKSPTQEKIEETKKQLNLSRKLPNINQIVQDCSFDEIINAVKQHIEYIYEKTQENFDVIKLQDFVFEYNSMQCIIFCNEPVCVSVQDNERMYIQIKPQTTSNKGKNLLYLYVFSLVDIASLPEKEYKVKLDRGVTGKFVITPSEAKEILVKIHELMNDYEENVCLPISCFDNKKVNDYASFIHYLPNYWEYFDSKKLFDLENQLGYTYDNFWDKYTKLRDERKKIIKYLDKADSTDKKESKAKPKKKIKDEKRLSDDDFIKVINKLREEGNSDEDIVIGMYRLYQHNEITFEQLEAFVKAVGWEITEEFKNMSEKDKKTKGLVKV